MGKFYIPSKRSLRPSKRESEAQPKGSGVQPEGSEAQLERSEGQPKGLRAYQRRNISRVTFFIPTEPLEW